MVMAIADVLEETADEIVKKFFIGKVFFVTSCGFSWHRLLRRSR